jgi:hypothetical protein
MVTNVAAGVAPVLSETLAPPLAQLATSVVTTPDELKKKALDLAANDVVAPFLHAGSEKLGDALAGALVQGAGLTPKPAKTPQGKPSSGSRPHCSRS